MTRETTRKTIEYTIMIVVAAATVFFSLGLARRELDGKEDIAAHAMDLERLRSRIDLQFLRDSSDRAETRRILRDVACEMNARRGYCQGWTP